MGADRLVNGLPSAGPSAAIGNVWRRHPHHRRELLGATGCRPRLGHSNQCWRTVGGAARETQHSGSAPSPAAIGPLLADQLETAPGEVMKLSHGGGGTRTRTRCAASGRQRDTEQPDTFSAAANLQNRYAQRSSLGMARVITAIRRRRARSGAPAARSSSPGCPKCRLSRRRLVSTHCRRTKRDGGGAWGVRCRCSTRSRPMPGPLMSSRTRWAYRARRWRNGSLTCGTPMQHQFPVALQVAAQELLIGSKSLAAVAEQGPATIRRRHSIGH